MGVKRATKQLNLISALILVGLILLNLKSVKAVACRSRGVTYADNDDFWMTSCFRCQHFLFQDNHVLLKLVAIANEASDDASTDDMSSTRAIATRILEATKLEATPKRRSKRTPSQPKVLSSRHKQNGHKLYTKSKLNLTTRVINRFNLKFGKSIREIKIPRINKMKKKTNASVLKINTQALAYPRPELMANRMQFPNSEATGGKGNLKNEGLIVENDKRLIYNEDDDGRQLEDDLDDAVGVDNDIEVGDDDDDDENAHADEKKRNIRAVNERSYVNKSLVNDLDGLNYVNCSGDCSGSRRKVISNAINSVDALVAKALFSFKLLFTNTTLLLSHASLRNSTSDDVGRRHLLQRLCTLLQLSKDRCFRWTTCCDHAQQCCERMMLVRESADEVSNSSDEKLPINQSGWSDINYEAVVKGNGQTKGESINNNRDKNTQNNKKENFSKSGSNGNNNNNNNINNINNNKHNNKNNNNNNKNDEEQPLQTCAPTWDGFSCWEGQREGVVAKQACPFFIGRVSTTSEWVSAFEGKDRVNAVFEGRILS